MRRFDGRGYRERQADRQKNATIRAAAANSQAGTLQRLAAFISVIEASFKPEADAMYERIVKAWKDAYNICAKYVFDENAIRRAVSGYEAVGAQPYIPKGHAGYEAAREASEKRQMQWKFWLTSAEYVILSNTLITTTSLDDFAEKNAFARVEDAKGKLFASVANKLQDFKTVEVESTILVKSGVKGFQGEFIINTDKGRFNFDCKAIPAQGPIQTFHFRYLAHVKAL